MNTYFLNKVKQPIINFIKNVEEVDLKLVLGSFYRENALEYFQQLRDKDLPTRFVEGFPVQSTQLPAFSFILGNDDSQLYSQSYSAETEELSSEVYQKFVALMAKIIGEQVSCVDIKAWLHQTSIIIGIHSMNKIETTWLCLVLDFILKSLNVYFQMQGIIDLSFNFTDLRVNPELFKLQSSTRICQVKFKYQKYVPITSWETYQIKDFDLSLK